LLGREDLLLGKSDEESALQFRLDVAKLNLMLSSEPLQTGTGSSNSPRSATQSVSFPYILEQAETPSCQAGHWKMADGDLPTSSCFNN
jgi:hypothetical protein